MNLAAKIVAGFVAVEHVLILIMEMFLWRTLGAKIFKLTPEFAEQSANLAMNQGLYNGFLAAGLVWALLYKDANIARQIALFFLGCIVVAGVFGAATAKITILFTQGLPALIGFLLWYLVKTK